MQRRRDAERKAKTKENIYPQITQITRIFKIWLETKSKNEPRIDTNEHEGLQEKDLYCHRGKRV